MAEENNKLLVVEDDPGLQSQIRWCFENFEVLLANDRASALEQVRLHRPPVVTLFVLVGRSFSKLFWREWTVPIDRNSQILIPWLARTTIFASRSSLWIGQKKLSS